MKSIGIVFRFRDLVTEAGGTIEEHRLVQDEHGYVWWGWWKRQNELVPRKTLAGLFPAGEKINVPVTLFDADMLRLYDTNATEVIVAPSSVGIESPDLNATPGYYIRGQYLVWFRLGEQIAAPRTATVQVLARPTLDDADQWPLDAEAEAVALDVLRDEKPTLWLSTA